MSECVWFVCLFVFLLFFSCWIVFLKETRERERERERKRRERQREGEIYTKHRDRSPSANSFEPERQIWPFVFLLKNLLLLLFITWFHFLFAFFFPDIFPHLTVDSMKASISHDFGCYTFKSCLKKSSIRIGAREIGIFVLRKRNKLKKWEFQTEKKEKERRVLKYSSQVVQTD